MILSGDIELNPGPGFNKQLRKKQNAIIKKTLNKRAASPKCSICKIGVGNNRKRLLCTWCLELTHVSCSNLHETKKKSIKSAAPIKWTCNSCYFHELPFSNCRSIPDNIESNDAIESNNAVFENLQEKFKDRSSLKVMHLNTQSLISTFPEFTAYVNDYPFDVYTLSETWLTSNK